MHMVNIISTYINLLDTGSAPYNTKFYIVLFVWKKQSQYNKSVNYTTLNLYKRKTITEKCE